MKVTVSKKSTVNIGNYNNIQPNVELTVDNVKTKDALKVYEIISEIASCFYGLNLIDLVNEADILGTLTNSRIREVINIADKEDIIKNINMRVKELNSLGYEV
jgi:hypothetical protein